MIKNKIYGILLLIMMLLTLGACGTKRQDSVEATTDFSGLSCTGSMELSYATRFQVDEYGQYDLITIVDGGRFLLVPEGVQVPENLPDDIVILQQPLNRTYLVSTSVMDVIRAIDCMDHIRLSGTKEDGWYIEAAKQAMQAGDILYAGKYSAPDYELILSEGCDLAIENTMINHNPEVKEKLESLGIPVFIECSSYEPHPLGRLEWIKLYGLLFGKEQEAKTYYEEQLAQIEPIMKKEQTGTKVAFFYVTSNGAVNVRKPNDYIAQMIQLSGGQYMINSSNEEEQNALSTMNMQMEDFYLQAKDSDILIYNSTIVGEIDSIDDLIDRNALFADFKAVQDGNVYCTSNNFFQETTGIGSFMSDLDKIFTKDTTDTLQYLKKLN